MRLSHPSFATPRYESAFLSFSDIVVAESRPTTCKIKTKRGSGRRSAHLVLGSAPAAEGRKPAASSASTIAFFPHGAGSSGGALALRRPPRLYAEGLTSTRLRAALPGITGCKREDPLRHQCSQHLAVRSRAGRSMPRAARICSVSLQLREPPPPRLRSTLAKASFRGRDSDSGMNVTYEETIVKDRSRKKRPFAVKRLPDPPPERLARDRCSARCRECGNAGMRPRPDAGSRPARGRAVAAPSGCAVPATTPRPSHR